MLYEYKDEFLNSKTSEEELQELENKYIEEAEKLNITDPFYKQEFVVARVYAEIAMLNIEGEGMQDKFNVYKQKADEVFELAKTNSLAKIKTIEIGRA